MAIRRFDHLEIKEEFGNIFYGTYRLPDGKWRSTGAWENRKEALECMKCMARGRAWQISNTLDGLEGGKRTSDEAWGIERDGIIYSGISQSTLGE